MPAKQATRWMAPAAPVFAARPLPQVQHIPSAGGVPVGAGLPAKQATRWMAPAAPVFAGAPAPTGMAHSISW